MIIELFGPPCVGKTTLAQLLGSRLRGKGLDVELPLSSRPSEEAPDATEQSPRHHRPLDAARRLTRPVIEMLANGRDLFGRSPEAQMAAALLKLLPPRSIMWSARLRQYIWRRAHAWHARQNTTGIVIFDQAFIQVIFSLVVAGDSADEALIAQALDAVPMPDLLIRLQAPPEIVGDRLADRRCRQGPIERLLEVDVRSNLESLPVMDVLHRLLRGRGQSVICVNTADPQSSDEVLGQLEQEVMARLAPIEAAA
jgi:thymidylate kinase